MLKGKNKYIIIAVIVILLIAVFVVLKFYPKMSSSKNVIQGSGGDTTTYQETWEDVLYKKLEQRFNKKYSKNYKFDMNGQNELKMSLGELEAHGVKLSDFNTDTIHCDFMKSYVMVSYDSDHKSYMRSYYLECTNDEDIATAEVDE